MRNAFSAWLNLNMLLTRTVVAYKYNIIQVQDWQKLQFYASSPMQCSTDIISHRLPIYEQPPQMTPDGNNLDTAALARKSDLHKYALVNVLANATNQTRGTF